MIRLCHRVIGVPRSYCKVHILGRTEAGRELGQGLAPGAIAAVGGVAGHLGVAAGGADEPFSVGTGCHFLEGIAVDAVGAADHFHCRLSRTTHSGDEGVARVVDGTALLVNDGGLGSQWLGADGAMRRFRVHISGARNDQIVSFSSHRRVCRLTNTSCVFYPVEANQ